MTATGENLSFYKYGSDPDYERFDTVGLNYRMPQIVAAVCYAQLKNAKKLLKEELRLQNISAKQLTKSKILIEQKKIN